MASAFLRDPSGRSSAATGLAQAGSGGGPLNRQQRRAERKHGRPPPLATAPTQSARPDLTASAVPALFAAALQHHQAGRLNEAAPLYRQVLAIDPRHADSLNLAGVVAHETGRPDLAADLIGKALEIKPNEASYHSNLGTALWKQGRLDAAAACYRAAIARNPNYPKAHFNLGTVLWQQRRLDEADACYCNAIHLKPDYPEAHDNLGTVRKELGRLDEAVICYIRALAFRPDYPEAQNNLGTVLWQQGRLDDAIGCYRRALALRPGFSEAHFNLGIAVGELGQLDAAVDCYRSALALRPDYPEAYDNLGTTLKELGRLDEAVACYRKALELAPEHPEAHSNLGIALLARGDFAAGWEEHEWRLQTPQLRKAWRNFPQPQWRGEAAAGRTLLIHAEQGFGDTLQFCRYGALAAARGLRVILEVQPPLVRLLRGLPGVDRVVARGDALPPFDLHCPMLSLPLAFGTTLETIPGAACYLRADPEEVTAWETRLATLRQPARRVGLAWAGNPRAHSRGLAAVDRRRSMAPAELAPLFQLPGVQFVSLQKSGPAAPAEFPLTDLMAAVNDFADTAALVANLDLVISVDTAVAHLAAALGKPVWLLDRFDPCWRWLTGRRDSPWYPTLRLYRQPRPGDWEAVVAEVVRDLRVLQKNSPSP